MPENMSRDAKQKFAIVGLSLTVIYLLRKNQALQHELMHLSYQVLATKGRGY